MLIVARLSPFLLTRLRVVVGREHALVVAESWEALRRLIQTRPAEVAVVDPCADGYEDPADVAPSVRVIRGVANAVTVVVYASLTPASTRAMLTLSASGVRHFVFAGVDDEPTRFRERLEEFRAPGMEEEVLAPLLTALAAARVPTGVSDALRALFRTPRRFRTAEDVAAVAGMTRQHLNRCLAEAGLVPARVMVAAAHVLRAYHYARVPGLTTVDIATRLRYADTRTLARHVRELTGATLVAWSVDVTPAECVALITAQLGMGARRPLVLLQTAASG
jgi:AraC-like DNA-binding protein